MTVIHEVIQEIERNSTFLVSTHINPEGDALGSALALALALRTLGKKALVVNRDPVPRFLDFLPYQGIFQQRNQVAEPYDVLAVLDCGDLARTALFDPQNLPATRVINIDHHLTNQQFGHINWIQVEATATGEMIFELIKAMGINMTSEMALCIYTSIVTETGSFRYSNTSSRTFLLAAELVGHGVEPWRVAQQLFERNTTGQLKLLADLLSKMEVSRDGRMAWVEVTQDLFSATKTSAEDIENFVNYPRSIEGVEVAILFRELSSDSYKLSFRSKGRVDVARLAEQFGGGGHRNAAGCVVKGRRDQVREKVLPAVEEAITRAIGKT
ncbi:MAG: DHH family phosphoesterase [Nitrospiria bacterium]